MVLASVSIQTDDFDLTREVQALRSGDGRIGAVAAFVGTLREVTQDQRITGMELEHYPGMTERAIEQMIAQAQRRFGILGARVVHRVGSLRPQDQIMMVAVAAEHRGAAFQACEYLMDFLKTQAPFWKKEHTSDGASHWVEARASDDAAAQRWHRVAE